MGCLGSVFDFFSRSPADHLVSGAALRTGTEPFAVAHGHDTPDTQFSLITWRCDDGVSTYGNSIVVPTLRELT